MALSKRNHSGELTHETTANVLALAILVGSLVAIGYAILDQKLDNIFGIFIAFAVFAATDRVCSIYVSHIQSKSDDLLKATMLDAVSDVCNSLAKRGLITDLGRMDIGLSKLREFVESARLIRDVTFRTDRVGFSQYGEELKIYANAVWNNIHAMENYQLIVDSQCEDYRDFLFTGDVTKISSPSLPLQKFSLKLIDNKTSGGDGSVISYPNFTIFFDRDGTKRMVLGWPFSEGSITGSIFLIEQDALITHFDRIFDHLWRSGRPISLVNESKNVIDSTR